MKDQINQVSDTAFMAAAYRAMETNHPNTMYEVTRIPPLDRSGFPHVIELKETRLSRETFMMPIGAGETGSCRR